jgi:hypothetical protein
MATPVNFVKVADPLSDQGRTLGIISTSPGVILGLSPGEEATTTYPVALAGRVPVKVTAENGAIEAGNYITLSNNPGVAMKATEPGNVIGQALEGYSGASVGKIMVFVKNTYYDGEVSGSMAVASSTGSAAEENLLADQGLGWKILAFLDNLGVKIMNGIAYLKDTFVEKLTVGSSEKPTGITIYDEITKNPYCIKMSNGTLLSTAGACSITELLPVVEEPLIEPSPDPDPDPDPAPAPNPAPTPAPSEAPPAPTATSAPDIIPATVPPVIGEIEASPSNTVTSTGTI